MILPRTSPTDLPLAGVRRWYSIGEVAVITGISRSTLYRVYADTGEVLPGVPAVKVRNRIIVPCAPVDRLSAGESLRPMPAASVVERARI